MERRGGLKVSEREGDCKAKEGGWMRNEKKKRNRKRKSLREREKEKERE